MKYTYKGKTFYISTYDEGEWEGWFYVENRQPYNFEEQQTFAEMKDEIRYRYHQYHVIIPETKEGWIKLFGSCVIRDGYEDWHIDEELAMRTLELYRMYGQEG